MAFFTFEGGVIDRIALQFLTKFQSFKREFEYLKGYTVNSVVLDELLLSNLTQKQWLQQSEILQDSLSKSVVDKAFKEYPDVVYNKYSEEHSDILLTRLKQCDSIALFFHEHLTEN